IGLLGAVPRVDVAGRQPLVPIQGSPPLLVDLPPGCPFQPRCPVAVPGCGEAEPVLVVVPGARDGHSAACVRAHEIRDGRIGGRPVYPVPTALGEPSADVPRERRPAVLEVQGLSKTFPLLKGAILKRRVGWVYAVSGVDLDIREGETLGLVGESGCGKTSTLLEIMNLRPPQSGSIRLGGADIAEARGRDARRRLRRTLQMVFQDPVGSLDPRMPVFDILAEPLQALGDADQSAISARVEELMDLVGLDPGHSDRFPAAFSGGQRQRIAIARALATSPSLLVLDEPVSALDVSIQAGVINLLNELKAKLGLSYLFVAHDLAVVRHISDRVAVMYLGRIVEIGAVDEVFDNPRHPYTQALLSAIPVPDPVVERSRERVVLRGELPSPIDSAPGCRFASRCPLRVTLDAAQQARCISETPELIARGSTDQRNACHFR
ncbi:MAG TPA: oligopeptide/dipeptide ABC transporter ATP-binding protein, partial [Pseudonocardiaceae bacterium]|nr:oligopeptide/dipeptide ABC transporter ATP-binding protein [Pseudonocardiaceae bacterium]